MSDLSIPTKVVKGILGDNYVGKTYLCHKLAGRNYQGYKQTTQISQFKPQGSQQVLKFVYIDNPPLDNLSIINIGCVYQYDILVFLFKDCDSFTKLFQFIETIRQTLASLQNHHVRQYWSQAKKIIAVYSNFQSARDIQSQQLFTILVEQIREFCNQVIFQSFILKKQRDSWKDLKFLIQKQPINLFMNSEISDIIQQAKSASLKKQQSIQQGQTSGQIDSRKEVQVKKQQTLAKTKDFAHMKNKNQPLMRQKIIIGDQVKRQNKQEPQNQDLKRSTIRSRIRQSFKIDQFRKSPVDNFESYTQINKKQEVRIQNKNNNILPSFRQTKGYTNPKIDQQLIEYNKEKTKKLQNYVQISEDQIAKQSILQKTQQSIKKYEVNPQQDIQNSKIDQVRKRPQSEFVSKNKKQKKAQHQQQKCNCQIL